MISMKKFFLVGYMGSGKTTVGRIVAKRLGYSFVDLDAKIEEKYFKSVSSIFSEMGEDQFRIIEKKCLHEVSEFEQTIISTGGGTPCFFDNMNYMNSLGNTIYLKFTSEELAQRLELSAINKRPLIQNLKAHELVQFINEGLKIREPYYSKASITLSGSIEAIVEEICRLISLEK